MKKVKVFLAVLILVIIGITLYNRPKLNIISGYNAKYLSSSVFVANRTEEFTNKTDLKFSPLNLASNIVSLEAKSATSSSFNLLTRSAIYREGLGSVLIIDDSDIKDFNTPKRLQSDDVTPYPYGNGKQKDTIFKNIDYLKIKQAIDTLFNKKNQTRAALVIYKDRIITERYAENFDENSVILGWSMAKSIVATLYGVLEYQKKINVQEKTQIPEWQKDERRNITFHNLLQMNSGLEWEEDYTKISDATKMLFLSKDMGQQQVNKTLVGKPNETWNYSSGTTNLLSKILISKFNTHQEYLDFVYTDLIDKINMNSMLIETDLMGNYVMSSYGWATARDWAKLGLLYLHKGNWNGVQIFDKNWSNYATSPTPSSNGEYGAQIWLNKGNKYPDVSENMYSFDGYQGQNVFILPDHELVVVRMGLTKNADMNRILKEIVNAIE